VTSRWRGQLPAPSPLVQPYAGLRDRQIPELLKAGRAAGLQVVGEVFADRVCGGRLARRTQKLGAIIHDVDTVIERSVRMVKELNHDRRSIVGLRARPSASGDTPGADELAAKMRAALENAGIAVAAGGRVADSLSARRSTFPTMVRRLGRNSTRTGTL
jgi:hypothetical protein